MFEVADPNRSDIVDPKWTESISEAGGEGRGLDLFEEISRSFLSKLNLSSKYLYSHFGFAEGKNTKISSKYQNPSEA